MASFIEIVGLESSTNGRSCNMHETCGESVGVGDVLRLTDCVPEHNKINKRAAKFVKIIDGQDTCSVAFVPRVTKNLPKVQQHLNKFVQVSDTHIGLKNFHKQSKSEANHRMAVIKLLLEDASGMKQ